VYSVTEDDMESQLKFSECYNPFEEMRHSTQRKKLRNMMDDSIFPHLTSKGKVCGMNAIKN
jgi:hypothetical protein